MSRMKSTAVFAAIGMVAALLAGSAPAQDLSHNAGSTLTLTGNVSYDNVAVGVTGGNASTAVDATGTGSFITNGSTVYVGVNLGSTTGQGKLYLGANNTINATTRIVIGGNQPDSDSSGGHNGTVTTTADGMTTLNTPYMAVGTSKGTGTFTLGSNATLNLGDGDSRTELIISRHDAYNGYNRPANGNMNLSAGIASLYLSNLVIGRKTVGGNSQNVYTGTGTLTLSSNALNHLDISGSSGALGVVTIGYSSVPGFAGTGTLTIGNLSATSSITSTDNGAAIRLGVGDLGNGTLNFNGGTLTLATTGAGIAGANGTSRLYLDGGATLIAGAESSDWIHSLTTAEIKAGGVTFDTNGHDIGISQAFSGAGGQTKAGDGTLTLTGNSTYAGNTAIDAGTLLVNGSLGNTAVAVNSGGTLGGIGTIGGAVTASAGGTLAPGASVGTLGLGSSLSLLPGSIFDWEFNSTALTADLLNVAGPVDLTDSILQLSDLDPTDPLPLGTKFTLLSYDDSLDGTFAGLADNDIFSDAGYLWQINYADPVAGLNGGAYGNFVTLTVAVPEPSSVLLLAFGLLGLLIRRRR